MKKNHGYTMIETLIYLSLFAVLSILVINALITVMSSFSATRTNRDLLEAGSTSMERISREIRRAETIDLENSTLSSSPGVLQLYTTSNSEDSQTLRFITLNGVLKLYRDGAFVDNLIGQNITVTSLFFRRIITSQGEAIKIEMTLRDNNSKFLQTSNFYNTIILKGEY
jgi:type II secretory pathway pseudopilin PulG